MENDKIGSPINYERDNALVELSRSIANIYSAKQSKTLNPSHLEIFKNSFIRFTNLTKHYDKLRKTKYKKTEKLLLDLIEITRNEETTIKNVDSQILIASEYISETLMTEEL